MMSRHPFVNSSEKRIMNLAWSGLSPSTNLWRPLSLKERIWSGVVNSTPASRRISRCSSLYSRSRFVEHGVRLEKGRWRTVRPTRPPIRLCNVCAVAKTRAFGTISRAKHRDGSASMAMAMGTIQEVFPCPISWSARVPLFSFFTFFLFCGNNAYPSSIGKHCLRRKMER